MADLYNTVKKQGEQIDDLQKEVTNHSIRIETLETKSMAIPPPPQPILPKEIKVELPPDIATNTRISRILDEKLANVSGHATLKKIMEQLPDALANSVAKIVINHLGLDVRAVMKEGIREEFADERKELRAIVSDIRYKAQSIIQGQWWHTIPKWIYVLFASLLVTTFGFGYGFFYQLDENSKLKDVEWLYRRERTLYHSEKDLQLLLNHEKEFFAGTTHEQDSIKQLIRYWEQQRALDKTFLYFNPTED